MIDDRIMRLVGVALAVCMLEAVAASVTAQSTIPAIGDCDPPIDDAYLDVGNVRARIFNSGILFWRGNPNIYEVPKGSGTHSVFASGFWIGGQLDDEVRMSAVTYGPFEMWAGPIPDDGSPPTDCARYDRIYELRMDGDASSGDLTGDIGDWPADLGAPYIEEGGSPDSYDPDEGDRPRMLGDQMLWWIMNDAGNFHAATDTPPLGAEVRTSVFAFAGVDALGSATFYRYRIRNRSPFEWRSMRVGLFFDPDVGDQSDDYLGSDSTLGLAFVYNATDTDAEYGIAPPAVGLTVLRRPQSTITPQDPVCRYPDGRSQGLTAHVPYPGPVREPYTSEALYQFLMGNRLIGEPLRIGQYPGPTMDSTAPVTRFIYPGDPVDGEYWSEVNPGPAGNHDRDRRSVPSVGPFCLGPGDETEVVFAIVWARGESNLDSVRRLRIATAGMHEIADFILTPRDIDLTPAAPEPAPFAASLFPNPADRSSRFRLGLPQPMDVSVTVFDALGRRVHSVVDTRLEQGEHVWTLQTSEWPTGVYHLRMQLDHITETRRLVVTR